MPVSAHDVARELRRRDPSFDVLQLQKLLYYVQAWNLVWRGAPAFPDPVEAWTWGPVVRGVYNIDRYRLIEGATEPMLGDLVATIDYVVERYGSLPGGKLIELTHAERPYRLTALNDPITLESMREYYSTDAEYVALQAEAERLAEHRAAIFGPLEMTDDLRGSIRRARTGHRIVEPRPA